MKKLLTAALLPLILALVACAGLTPGSKAVRAQATLAAEAALALRCQLGSSSIDVRWISPQRAETKLQSHDREMRAVFAARSGYDLVLRASASAAANEELDRARAVADGKCAAYRQRLVVMAAADPQEPIDLR